MMLLCRVKKKKIETPGDVSIFLVNGEKKNSGNLLLASQFELFTSFVEPTNECGICSFYIGTRSHKSDGFFPVPEQYLYLFFTNYYSCSPLLLFPTHFFFIFFFYARHLCSFHALICENRSFSPQRIWKKVQQICSEKKAKGGGIKAGYYVEPDIITLWHNLFDC